MSETQHNQLLHITSIQRITQNERVWIDRFTITNLELYHSTNQNAVTLIDVIDKITSPMGGRLLRVYMRVDIASTATPWILSK